MSLSECQTLILALSETESEAENDSSKQECHDEILLAAEKDSDKEVKDEAEAKTEKNQVPGPDEVALIPATGTNVCGKVEASAVKLETEATVKDGNVEMVPEDVVGNGATTIAESKDDQMNTTKNQQPSSLFMTDFLRLPSMVYKQEKDITKSRVVPLGGAMSYK